MEENKIAANTAGVLLDKLAEADRAPEALAAELGLMQVSDTGAIDAAIDALIAANPKSLTDYKAGKQSAMGSLIGMVMKSAKGLNPKMVGERLRERLSG
jgi:aspartyl-tRNA(Asn)/glutamyl-tRNA(Gln) amidotransferase subunit B